MELGTAQRLSKDLDTAHAKLREEVIPYYEERVRSKKSISEERNKPKYQDEVVWSGKNLIQ